jgi:hypothetical protein
VSISLALPMLRRLSKLTGIPAEKFRTQTRKREIVRPRFAAMLVLRERTDWSLPVIAHFFNLADHTTVRHAIKVAADLYGTDPDMTLWLDELRQVEAGDPFADAPMPNIGRPKPKAPALPKYTGPIVDRYHDEQFMADGKVMRLDRHGNTEFETLCINDVRHGSRLLAEAILRERGIAA